MSEQDWLAERFEAQRPHLRAVAYRMLGSVSEADDAVQEAWLRLSRSDPSIIDNLGGWLTTVVARVCLNMLQARRSRREHALGEHLPDPIVSREDELDPEHEALLADSVGLALLVVLDTLTPAERVAFVLHDVFAVPFDEIAPIVNRSPTATRQLASRARRRVRGAPVPDTDIAGQRQVMDAFIAAVRDGDFERLVGVLDPDIVLRSDGGTARPGLIRIVRGAEAVASEAMKFHALVDFSRYVLVNGALGAVTYTKKGDILSVGAFTIQDDRIVEVDFLADPNRLRELDLTFLDD